MGNVPAKNVGNLMKGGLDFEIHKQLDAAGWKSSALHPYQRGFDGIVLEFFLGLVGVVLFIERAQAHPVNRAARLFALTDPGLKTQ